MDKIANTVNINLYAEASCPDVEYNVSIDDVGQITITPIEANCNFTNVSREPFDNNVAIYLVANMTSSDDNFDYFLDIDDIGQIIITPDSENSNFESVTEGADLNLVTECKHIQRCDEKFDNERRSVYDEIADTIVDYVEKHPEKVEKFNTLEDLIDELSVLGIFEVPAFAPGFECYDECNICEEEIERFIHLLIQHTNLQDRIKLNNIVESLQEETPYTREQVEEDLRSLTMNWTREDTLKTGFEIEHQYAMEILSKHYETVYDEGRKGEWYYIRFVGPMVNECLTEAVGPNSYAVIKPDGTYAGVPCENIDEAKELAAQEEGRVIYKLSKVLFNESYKDYNFSVSCNDGPKKNVRLVWDEKDPEGAKDVAKKYYAQEHTTYADDRENKWTIEESLSEAYDNYYTRSDVEAVREKFKKWAFKVDSQHPGFDRYTCKVNDYLLECVFDHKFGTPEEKCFTARVLLNRKMMDYFFTAEDALDFMLANAENKTLDEALLEGDRQDDAKEAFMNMFGDVEKDLEDLMSKWEDLKKNIEQQKRDAEKESITESKQGECEKCGHVLTDGGECPVCDLGDEEERTSHTIYDINECLTTDSDKDQGAQLDESVSGKEAEEILRVAKQLGIETAADLIRFYEDHPAFDEHKLEEIQDYRDEVGRDFKLAEGARVSFDLDGKNYRGMYRGQSTTNPDMADVEIDDDQYENPDPYGRYINRRPIYNKHEDRYIKDGKFFIPHSELRFVED